MTDSARPTESGELRTSFNAAAKSVEPRATSKRRKPTSFVISFRVSGEEKAKLERHAAGTALSSHVRDLVVGTDAKPRKTRGKFPVKDHEALGRVLGALGRSNLSNDLGTLTMATDDGMILLSPETDAALRRAFEDVIAMRADLLRALGLKAVPP